MNHQIFIALLGCFLLFSCIKEEINSVPKIVNYTVSSNRILPGDTVTITVTASDAEKDNLYYEWSNNNSTFVSDSTSSEIQWKVPYLEGSNIVTLELRDENVKISKEIELFTEASIADDFSRKQTNWITDNCNLEHKNHAVTITQTNENSDCLYLAKPDKAIQPPYALHIDLNTNQYFPLFSSTDKYGAYIDLWNVGADTLIKAIWFRIYPFSSTYTWKLSVLQDQGASSGWIDIASDFNAIDKTISKLTGVINKLKIAVLEDKTIQLYCNDVFLYETKAITTQFANDSVIPQLVLQSVGMRSSAGSVTVDNVYLSSKTDLLTNELFK